MKNRPGASRAELIAGGTDRSADGVNRGPMGSTVYFMADPPVPEVLGRSGRRVRVRPTAAPPYAGKRSGPAQAGPN
jgi:hypothetical protein